MVAGAVALGSQGHVELRVFAGGTPSTLGLMAGALAKADVVFVGEAAPGPRVQRAEVAILEAVARSGRRVVLALGSLDRDLQEPLDHVLMQHATVEEFVADARPGEAFERDHRPLVDLAVQRMWPVVAANVPRRIVTAVLADPKVTDSLAATDRGLVAARAQCDPPGTERLNRRFLAINPGQTGVDSRTMGSGHERALCLEDETIAESVAQGYAAGAIAGGQPLVVAVTRSVHAERDSGAVAGARRRLANARVAVVAIVPRTDAATAVPAAQETARADYVVFTEP
jgi:hypothetical protein